MKTIAMLMLAALPLVSFQGDRPPYPVGGGVTAPSIVHKVDAVYTQDAKDGHVEGAVGLSVVVDESGKPQNVRVVKALDPGLDKSAINAVEQWTFKPGEKDGKPVKVQARINVDFHLQ